MKKFAPILALCVAILGQAGCDKTDDYPFICDGFQQDAPAGDSADIKMPTAFTPNGDGLNDVLKPFVKGVSSITITVYNVNDRVIFTSNNAEQGYAASRPMDKDMYYYRIEAVSNKGNRVARCGSVYALNCLPAGSRLTDFIFSDQFTANNPYLGTTAETLTACP